ncbi:MAG TPA: tRNA (adenosine(37)-N6)-dimethylallyltransferase MiaA [Verrucomicrobiae bacterium]|nr:tRNA (adenosine(37)-N6)-dimethylallyltransferase MiaA [Verrucomicrobiae bacterium]
MATPAQAPPAAVYIAGPTAVGKSEIAILLAERINGEIISVDSMQVYRGLDIGTAKPSLAEQQRVRHHLIDVVGLEESFDAAQFVRLARAAEAGIRARGRVPIFCGGTGLYIQAFLGGLGEAPPADPELRAQLEAAEPETLLAELKERDPITHEQIDRKNLRRVVRALEVIRLTGKPFSSQRAAWDASASSVPNFFGIARLPADLRDRINRRVDRMFDLGLVEETRGLIERGLTTNPTPMQAIGYRQVVEYLQGDRSLADTIELVKVKTRQFAKRQMTWFRKAPGVQWIELDATTNFAGVVETLANRRSRLSA